MTTARPVAELAAALGVELRCCCDEAGCCDAPDLIAPPPCAGSGPGDEWCGLCRRCRACGQQCCCDL